MSKTKDLGELSAEQLQEFLTSFDLVLSDIDGVVWHVHKPIKGAFESLMALQKLGKQIYLVTNNSTNGTKFYVDKAQAAGLNINSDHVITTAKVVVWYLKKINFRGEVFAIASAAFQNTLIEAGIQLVKEPVPCLGNVAVTLREIVDRPSVKAVITDFDVHCNWSKLALAISCLKREDVLFISGAIDTWLGGQGFKILGPGPLINVISAQSGKRPFVCSKPSQILKDYIFYTCKVSDPQRCLFIGDTVNQDMKFASMCGFKKLFVGSGCDSLEEAQEGDDTCPDYYLPDLSQLFSVQRDP